MRQRISVAAPKEPAPTGPAEAVRGHGAAWNQVLVVSSQKIFPGAGLIIRARLRRGREWDAKGGRVGTGVLYAESWP